jgi:hypothetical protein
MSKVEIEYTRGGRRRFMNERFVIPLEKMGLIRRVGTADVAPPVSAMPLSAPAATPAPEPPLESPTFFPLPGQASEAEAKGEGKVEKPKRKYTRRDQQAEDGNKKPRTKRKYKRRDMKSED